jgi:maltose O-acetyltransferase
MSDPCATEAADVRRRLAEFLAGRTDERLFRHPIGHPSQPSEFCECDGCALAVLRLYLRGVLMKIALNLPFNGLKVWLLRRVGVKIGHNVYISIGAWIDAVYPQLVTIEDDVLIGMDARIMTHEFRFDEFRAGKVVIRRRAVVGGFSLIACGVEIGEGAEVAGGAVVALDVPPGTIATGNPAFIWKRSARKSEPRSREASPWDTAAPGCAPPPPADVAAGDRGGDEAPHE